MGTIWSKIGSIWRVAYRTSVIHDIHIYGVVMDMVYVDDGKTYGKITTEIT